MIFLSAQPDEYFFTWQIELQIYHFNQLGIRPEQIHVLIGYDTARGLRHYFTELIEKNKHKASFYAYPDNRPPYKYLSTLRPHIIHQHFSQHGWLYAENIFYHDSDIIFRELPDFDSLLGDDCWYVSDTRSYLDSGYIRSSANEQTFLDICDIVGVDPGKAAMNDPNCGGAQYVLKNIPGGFWQKIETDSESIYRRLTEENMRRGDATLRAGGRFNKHLGIQAWCADMWALFYNALVWDKEIRISEELDFCWASENIKIWQKKKILHYTGTTNYEIRTVFRKERYLHYPSYFDQGINDVSPDSSSYPVVELIHAFNKEREDNKTDLTDVSILMAVRVDSPSRLKNLLITTHYLHKYFKTNIHIIESDTGQKVPQHSLPPCCHYRFIEDANPIFHHTRINNLLVRGAKTPIIAIYDVDAILPLPQIGEAVNILRNHSADLVSPYDGRFISIDNLFKILFEKISDPDLFLFNQNKFTTETNRSWGGCNFMLRHSYTKAGMDNEIFEGWGPEDVERTKRMKNHGYIVRRVDGPLFHLPHERKLNSFYADTDSRIKYMEEYFRISNLSASQLRQYVSAWHWVT